MHVSTTFDTYCRSQLEHACCEPIKSYNDTPEYLIKGSAIECNETAVIQLGSVTEHKSTHNKILSIKHSQTQSHI